MIHFHFHFHIAFPSFFFISSLWLDFLLFWLDLSPFTFPLSLHHLVPLSVLLPFIPFPIFSVVSDERCILGWVSWSLLGALLLPHFFLISEGLSLQCAFAACIISFPFSPVLFLSPFRYFYSVSAFDFCCFSCFVLAFFYLLSYHFRVYPCISLLSRFQMGELSLVTYHYPPFRPFFFYSETLDKLVSVGIHASSKPISSDTLPFLFPLFFNLEMDSL